MEGQSKYFSYILSQSQLNQNNYPLDNAFEVDNFISTEDEDWPLLENKKDVERLLTLDCEMVETAKGYELARISIINEEYEEIYNKFVRPKGTIKNYHYK